MKSRLSIQLAGAPTCQDTAKQIRFKYDIDTDILLGEGYPFYGEGLYKHIAQLAQLAQECFLGIHVKPLSCYRSEPQSEKCEGNPDELEGRLVLPSHHLYPYLRTGGTLEEKKCRLSALYEKGKQLFGDAFFINFESQGVVREGPVYEHLHKICRDTRK